MTIDEIISWFGTNVRGVVCQSENEVDEICDILQDLLRDSGSYDDKEIENYLHYAGTRYFPEYKIIAYENKFVMYPQNANGLRKIIPCNDFLEMIQKVPEQINIDDLI